MDATVVNYRSSKTKQTQNHMIVMVNDVTTKDKAKAFVGKKVTWTSPAGKIIAGKVNAAHGNKGALRVVFEKGLPGQSIGTKVNIA